MGKFPVTLFILMRLLAVYLLVLLPFGLTTVAQTTQGVLIGRVRDQVTGQPLPGARIEYERLETNTSGVSQSSADGNYQIPLLPPGSYRVRVSVNAYQARETYGVTVPLAGYVQIDFDLRPLADVWEHNLHSFVLRSNTVLPYYGPDIDPSYVAAFEPQHQAHGQLEPSLSQVFDPQAIATLPLAGRDVYAALVLQPGVTADSTTSRSLGLSANGQRPTSSSFLLDGVEYTDRLLSGPAFQPAPEMVQEYRISTSNFSAEYGGTAGYIANAVTRSAGSRWHGIGYGDLNNSVLNANTFQHNTYATPRTALHQFEAGISAGGRIPGMRLRSWIAIDHFASRSFFDPATYNLPTQSFEDRLPPDSQASRLLHSYPPRQWADAAFGDYGPVTLQRPVTLRRFTGVERLDYSTAAKDRLTARLAGDTIRQPDFFWTPYGSSPLKQTSLGLMAADTRVWSPSFVTEVRVGLSSNRRSWDPALANIPYLVGFSEADLPASSNVNGWHETTQTGELSGNLIFSKSVQVLKMGAGVLDVRPHLQFTIPSAGQFAFVCVSCEDVHRFADDNPLQFTTALSQLGLEQNVYERPDAAHDYRYDQPYFFVQEDLRLSSRFTLNGGLRYERLSAPVNIGRNPDTLIQLGPGANMDQRVDAATLVSHRGPLYDAHANTFAVRLGFSLALSPARGTVLRGGAGTFYDRPPDNFWATALANDFEFVTFSDGYTRGSSAPCQLQDFYRSGGYGSQPPGCAPAGKVDFLQPTLFQNGLRMAQVRSAFLSLQQPLGRHADLEVNGAASRGRNLLATDILNRPYLPVNGLGEIAYRTDQGASVYGGLSSVLRYRAARSSLSLSWTWSHSIDTQSDPLLGEFFDLGFANQTDRTDRSYYSGFTVEGNSRVDRANSNFDQRQNVVGWASFALPGPTQNRLRPALRNWQTAAVFAVRSGLPYSVYAGDISCRPVCNRRADLVDAAAAEERTAVAGGVQLLNPAAFAIPEGEMYGTTGRNAFRGPGFANLDLSLSRTFSLGRWGEQTKAVLRADAFNVFNHANLLNPEGYLGSAAEGFGISEFGSSGQRAGFPALTPLIPNPRQIHILLRIEF